MQHLNPEQEAYQVLRHWEPLHVILPPTTLISQKSKLYPLFEHFYYRMRGLYQQLPRRKNGEDPFLHPLNVAYYLSQSSVKEDRIDDLAILCGLIHDFVEEQVDMYKKEHQVPDNPEGRRQLNLLEDDLFVVLQAEIDSVCASGTIPPGTGKSIVDTLKLLTRHKRHTYYQYISAIFQTKNRELKERALRVKLADRIHNVLCLDCFNERERIYQCFKNLFLLNNTKKFLLDHYGQKMFSGEVNNVTEKLFNKCIKATYDAFLTICHESYARKTYMVDSLLQLAFKKFELLHNGLRVVTELDESEPHLLRLYLGVVRKYDTRMHHEEASFKDRMQRELDYVRKFFRDYHFTEEQLQVILDYKDAYALKEVLAHLLYQPNYFVSLFTASELSKEGRIVRKKVSASARK